MSKIKHYALGLALISPLWGFAENYFNTLLGKSEEETKEKMESVWRHFFTPGDINRYDRAGEHSVYYLDATKDSSSTPEAMTCVPKVCLTE